jgi:hypothetical protein
MHSAGCTDDEIAREIHTTSRAVNGKRYRLGLTLNLDDPLVVALRRVKRELSARTDG